MTEIAYKPSLKTPEIGTAFNHVKWRNVLQETEKQLKQNYVDVSLIGPFGFELLCQAKDASKNIKKLYVYSSSPQNVNLDFLPNEIEGILLKKINAIYPELYHQIVVTILNETVTLKKDKNFVCLPEHKLLDIQVRKTHKNIINDYAEYLILSHQSILSNSGEARNYKKSFRCRSRVIQLFLMQEALFKGLIPPLKCKNKKFISDLQKLVSNEIQVFFCDNIDTDNSNYIIEADLFEEYIVPRSIIIKNLLEESLSGDKINIEITSYHIKSDLSCAIDSQLYYQLVNRVREAYQNFI